MPRAAVTLALLASVAFVSPALAEMMTFHAHLTGAAEVPPKTTNGTGDATVTLDTTAKTISYDVTYSGLTGPATMGHIHGPAAPGVNAKVVVPFKSVAMSPIKGTATVTDAQITDLEAGKYYVNIHTAANPGGEIRGQLMK